MLIVFSNFQLFAQQTISNETIINFSIENNEKYSISKIILEGNNQTKDNIIFRELEFKTGDVISGTKLYTILEDSRENLRNISLFNFVMIEANKTENNNHIEVIIRVLERWYIWPWPILEVGDRNFNTWLESKKLNRLNYGVNLRFNNFRGRREELSTLVQLGYNQVYQLSYLKPFLNKKETLGIFLSGGYSQSHEVTYGINSDNKELFVRNEDEFLKKQFFGLAELRFRPDIYNNHYLGIRYDNYIISDTVFLLNTNYTTDGKPDTRFLSAYYKFKCDHRDYKHYPLKGYYFDIYFLKNGLSLLNDEETDLFTIKTELRKYHKISERWFLASGITGKYCTPKNQPFFLEKGLGYERDFVRGYEYYVIDGQSFSLWKNQVKFALVQPQIQSLNFIKTTKFNTLHYAIYLNAYFDIGYVWQNKNNNSSLENKFLPGGGLGLDFVTYYDMIFRLEYSINKMGEKGFFIHFRASI